MIRPACFLLLSLALLSGFAAPGRAQPADILTVLAQRLATQPRQVIENGKRVSKTGIALAEICDTSDPLDGRIFLEYGAMWVGNNNAFAEFKQGITGERIRFLANCVFRSEAELRLYQDNVRTKSATVGGVTIELQEAAMDALLEARREAAKRNLSITPRGGSTAARRSYAETVRLWNSRFLPGLAHWTARGKIDRRDAESVRGADVRTQVARVLAWEERGYFFSRDLSKSILYSVAAPGASQHVFMLALDVSEFGNREVREILARHGWFQTVKSDLPHFTYLGVAESELPALGLKPVTVSGQKFWIPNL